MARRALTGAMIDTAFCVGFLLGRDRGIRQERSRIVRRAHREAAVMAAEDLRHSHMLGGEAISDLAARGVADLRVWLAEQPSGDP
jgi:hypothetical protein